MNQDSEATKARFRIGHQLGDIARRLYDPAGKGTTVDRDQMGITAALARSTELLATTQPVFEAGIAAGGALVFADVMLPARKAGKNAWRMVEVKSSTKVKDYYRDDTAIQAFVAQEARVPLTSIALAHIDNTWVYPGSDDYQGLLKEVDLTDEALGRRDEVKGWIEEAKTIAGAKKEPSIKTGRHCSEPYECGFFAYCSGQEPQPKYPIAWLPQIRTMALNELIEDEGVTDLRDVPDRLLNGQQLRVKSHTLSGKTYFDAAGAAADLAPHKLPAYFMDFETAQFAIPIWKGTRPYQQIPFQFSVHKVSQAGKLEHCSFLDLSGEDPSARFAEALIAACGERGPVFAYNAAFEKARIKELAERFPRLRRPLLAIVARVVDLLPVAQERYYHPNQQGSWSIKYVLPAISDLSYEALDGIQDGGSAMTAFQDAIAPATSQMRKQQIEAQLLAYCKLDTYGLVKIWQFFTGRDTIAL